MTGARAGDRGTSLLELVAVMAIFSLLAVAALQMLSAGTRARLSVVAAGAEAEALVAAAAVMRRDFEQAVPATDAPGLDLADGGLAFRTMAGGEGPPARVAWRHDPAARTLTRTTPGGTATLLTEVNGWRLRAAARGATWTPVASWSGADPAVLPDALEVELTLAGLGAVALVMAR